jgi:hypothetical protein
MTVQVTKLSLKHKLNKIGMICLTKSRLTEDIYIVKGKIFNIMLYVQYVHLTEAKQSIRDKPILSSDIMLRRGYDCKGSVAQRKKFWGELIACFPSMWYETHRKWHLQWFFYCYMCSYRCGNVFMDHCLAVIGGYTYRQTDGKEFMNYATEMG